MSSSIRPKWNHIKLKEEVQLFTPEFSLSSLEYLNNLHGGRNAFMFIKEKKEENKTLQLILKAQPTKNIYKVCTCVHMSLLYKHKHLDGQIHTQLKFSNNTCFYYDRPLVQKLLACLTNLSSFEVIRALQQFHFRHCMHRK